MLLWQFMFSFRLVSHFLIVELIAVGDQRGKDERDFDTVMISSIW
jgi:hypothetical protein